MRMWMENAKGGLMSAVHEQSVQVVDVAMVQLLQKKKRDEHGRLVFNYPIVSLHVPAVHWNVHPERYVMCGTYRLAAGRDVRLGCRPLASNWAVQNKKVESAAGDLQIYLMSVDGSTLGHSAWMWFEQGIVH